MKRHYDMLDVDEYSSHHKIKQNYKRLCKKYHPDLGGRKELFQELQSSYEWLKKYHIQKETKKFHYNNFDDKSINIKNTHSTKDYDTTYYYSILFTKPHNIIKINRFEIQFYKNLQYINVYHKDLDLSAKIKINQLKSGVIAEYQNIKYELQIDD